MYTVWRFAILAETRWRSSFGLVSHRAGAGPRGKFGTDCRIQLGFELLSVYTGSAPGTHVAAHTQGPPGVISLCTPTRQSTKPRRAVAGCPTTQHTDRALALHRAAAHPHLDRNNRQAKMVRTLPYACPALPPRDRERCQLLGVEAVWAHAWVVLADGSSAPGSASELKLFPNPYWYSSLALHAPALSLPLVLGTAAESGSSAPDKGFAACVAGAAGMANPLSCALLPVCLCSLYRGPWQPVRAGLTYTYPTHNGHWQFLKALRVPVANHHHRHFYQSSITWCIGTPRTAATQAGTTNTHRPPRAQREAQRGCRPPACAARGTGAAAGYRHRAAGVTRRIALTRVCALIRHSHGAVAARHRGVLAHNWLGGLCRKYLRGGGAHNLLINRMTRV
jgi:hypothetical protein